MLRFENDFQTVLTILRGKLTEIIWEQIMKKYRKGILDALFLIVLIGATFYFILEDQNLSKIADIIQESNLYWLMLGIVFVFVFICGESVIMKYLFHSFGSKIKLSRCIKYSFIGFFFSGVTPSATGGQPMQLYYMGRDKNKVSESCLVLLIITIGYKSALILLSGISFIALGDFIVRNLDSVVYILIYGVTVNVLFISFLLILIFNYSFMNKVVRGVTKVLNKFRIVKNVEDFQDKLEMQMQPYRDGAKYLKSHLNVFIHVLWMSVLQRTALFLVTWCVYRAFGLHGISAFKIVALQTIISLSVDMLPLPGGVGASEKSFEIMFDRIFGMELVIPGMILSRGISFYFLILVTGLVTIVVHLKMSFRDRRKQKEVAETTAENTAEKM